MIRDNPQGADLLKEARHVLTEKIMPQLSADAKYQLLMAVRAIKLAERQFQADRKTEAQLTEQLARFQETDSDQALSVQIRTGKWDASQHVFDILQDVTTFKLKETYS